MGRRSKNVTYNKASGCVIHFTLRGIDLRNRHNTSTENIRTDTQKRRETSIRKNALSEAGFPTLAEMRELNTTIVATQILMNKRHDQTILHQPQNTRRIRNEKRHSITDFHEDN
jgi:hypothetical protein